MFNNRVFVIFGARASGLSFGPRAYFLFVFRFYFDLSFFCTSSQEINLLSMGNHRKTVLLDRSIGKFVFEGKIFAIENEA